MSGSWIERSATSYDAATAATSGAELASLGNYNHCLGPSTRLVVAPLPAMAFHAAVTAFVAFVLLAFWEEKKDDAPAEALLVIIGTLFAWAQFNQQVWNKYLK